MSNIAADTSPHNPFVALWQAGFKRLVPIVPPDAPVSERSTLAKRPGARGKAVGYRGDDGLWRGFDWLSHETTTGDLARWHAMGAGVGVRTGAGLIAIDVDTLDKDLAATIYKLAIETLGPSPARVGRWPKHALLYRVDPAVAVPYTRVEFDGQAGMTERVELLSEGRQFVAPPSIHPSTGRSYEWKPAQPDFNDLTATTQEQIDAFFAELTRRLPAATVPIKEGSADRSRVDQNRLAGNPDAVRRAVDALPNTSRLFPTYNDYIRVGAAIKAALPDDPELALELFQQWCGRWSGKDAGVNEPERVASDWSRIKPPFALGASWLYEMAEKHGPKGVGEFNRAQLWFDDIPDTEPNPFEQAASAERQERVAAEARRFTFTSLDEAAASAMTTAARPLIKGLLDQGSMTVLYGESNTGKTFIATDIAWHIAAGEPWGGMKTTTFPVVYIAAEGATGARKRAAALLKKRGRAGLPFHFVLSPVDLLDPEADVNPLIASLSELKGLGLVVIDTLSRVLAGGDENSSEDMGALVRHVDLIRAATSAHVLLVHHSGKDRAKGARGHSLLRAATDTEIEIADGQIAVTKQRDLDKAFASAFQLEIVELGRDADGDPVTSCTVGLIEKGEEQPIGVATPAEQAIMEAIEALQQTSEKGSDGVSVADILSYFGGSSEDKMSSRSVRMNVTRAISKRLLVRVGRGRFKILKSDIRHECNNGIFD